MIDLSKLTAEEQEQYNAFLQEFTKNIDPTDYMPPSVRAKLLEFNLWENIRDWQESGLATI